MTSELRAGTFVGGWGRSQWRHTCQRISLQSGDLLQVPSTSALSIDNQATYMLINVSTDAAVSATAVSTEG